MLKLNLDFIKLNASEYIVESSFSHQSAKLVKVSALTQSQIDETIELYKSDKTNSKLHNHKIICKKDKCRRSIAVVNSNQQYKILLSEQVNVTYFIFIGHHRKYDRINKSC